MLFFNLKTFTLVLLFLSIIERSLVYNKIALWWMWKRFLSLQFSNHAFVFYVKLHTHTIHMQVTTLPQLSTILNSLDSPLVSNIANENVWAQVLTV